MLLVQIGKKSFLLKKLVDAAAFVVVWTPAETENSEMNGSITWATQKKICDSKKCLMGLKSSVFF